MPAYGSWPVLSFCTLNSEFKEFSTEIRSYVVTVIAGTAIACQELEAISFERIKDRRRGLTTGTYHVTRPHKSVPLRTIREHTATVGNRKIVVPGNRRNRSILSPIDLPQMHKRIPVLRINRADLIRIRPGIPDPIDQFIVTVKVARIIPQLVIVPMRHRRVLDGHLLHLNAASRVVQQAEVAEGAAFVLAFDGVVAGAGDVEPERLVDAGVGGGVATFAGDPEGGFSVGEADVLVAVDVADGDGDEAGDVLGKRLAVVLYAGWSLTMPKS